MKLLEGEFGKEITLEAIQDEDKFLLNSYGGSLDMGYAMHDNFKSRNIEVGVNGVCASAGTIAILGATNSWASENSKFIIHNPWGEVTGDAKKLSQTATELKAAQDLLVAFYVNNLNATHDEIVQMMDSEESLSAQRALEIGLIKEVRVDSLPKIQGKTAKEMFYNLITEKMSISKEQLDTELKSFESSFFDKIKNFFKPKNLLLKDTEGQELTFDVESEDQIAVGVTATAAGTAANGEYMMADGKAYVFEAGKLMEIKEPAPDEMEALKAENENLKAQIAEKETSIQNLKVDFEAKLGGLKSEVEGFKNVFSKKIVNVVVPVEKAEPSTSRKAFKTT